MSQKLITFFRQNSQVLTDSGINARLLEIDSVVEVFESLINEVATEARLACANEMILLDEKNPAPGSSLISRKEAREACLKDS